MLALQVLGGVLVAAGLGGLAYCIREGIRMRRSPLPQDQIRARIQTLIAVNLASVATAALGLAALLAGFLLG